VRGKGALTTTNADVDARADPGTLVLDLLAWLAREPRTRRETIETWGSHCPRLTPWEDAQDLGLVRLAPERDGAGRLAVVLTGRGWAALRAHRGVRPVATVGGSPARASRP
jgi:hypothetical protein